MLGSHSTRWAPGYYGQEVNGTNMPDDYNPALVANSSACQNFQNPYSSAVCDLGWNYTYVPVCPNPGRV